MKWGGRSAENGSEGETESGDASGAEPNRTTPNAEQTMTPQTRQDESTHPSADVIAKIGPAVEISAGDRREAVTIPGEHWDLPGCATAFCLGGDIFGTMANLTELRYGPDGLIATSNEPLEAGCNVSLGFEAHGYTARRGEVIACRPHGEGFRIAVRFEHRLAA